MSLAQQIRDAMRRLGGPATSAEIAEQCEDNTTASEVSTRLNNGEAQGWVHVDRSERPLRYTLIESAAAKTEAYAAENPVPRRGHASKHEAAVAQRKPAAEPAPSLDAKRSARSQADRGTAQSTPSAMQVTPPPAQVTAASVQSTPAQAQLSDQAANIAMPRSLILALCALALSPDEPNAADRRTIADAIRAAA